MKRWLKRIRGAVGMGLTWAAAWVGVGVVVGLVAGVVAPGAGSVVDWVVSFVRVLGPMGFVGGAIFSTALGIIGGRRLDEMELQHFAGLGGTVAGVLLFSLSLSTGGLGLVGVLVVPGVALLGAGSAAGSLALARRVDDRELLKHGADVADIGLTEQEKRELLA